MRLLLLMLRGRALGSVLDGLLLLWLLGGGTGGVGWG